jgi:hypothetical protein
MAIKHICLGCGLLVLMVNDAFSQRSKDEQNLHVYVAPNLGFRLMTGFTPPSRYYASNAVFRDSLNKADRPGQNLNIGVAYTRKKNALEAVSMGLGYTTVGFRRSIDEVRLGDTIHPKIGIVAGLVGSGHLQINQDFRYHYLEFSYLKTKSAEGYSRNLKEFDLWWTYGLSAGVLVRDRVMIETLGFSHSNGESRIAVKDDALRGFPANMWLNVGYKVDYIMFKKTNAFVHGRLRVPLLPSATGAQTIFLPQLGIEAGLIFKLNEEK